MNEPLLPCPFCGRESHLEEDCDDYFYCTCNTEHCPGNMSIDGEYGCTDSSVKTKEAAIQKWNTRTPLPASVKWPEKRKGTLEITSAGSKYITSFSDDGWNDCLKACKERNAPKESK